MKNFLYTVAANVEKFNEQFFSPLHNLLENLNMQHWLQHALFECLQMLPMLFLLFLAVEIIEVFYFDKIVKITKISKTMGPLIGCIFASLPQCGFSVIASMLYIKKYLTTGTLIAVYLATSDEAIPILLSNINSAKYVIPLILTKIFIATSAGYLIDFVANKITKKENILLAEETNIITEKGCHKHEIIAKNNFTILLHPIKHTISVFLFILIVSIAINYLMHVIDSPEKISELLLNNTIFQPMIAGVIGLIPNCAISVCLTMLYIKGLISYGATIAGLCSGAGLGLLVLFKHNKSIKDSMKITIILLMISIIAGSTIQIFYHPTM